MVFLAGKAPAGDLKVIPSISVKEEYTDNVFFDTSDDQIRDWISTVSPAITIANATPTSSASFYARMDALGYADHADLNRQNQDLRANMAFQASERFGVSAQAGYTVDSTPERDIETTGILLGTSPRQRLSFSSSVNYQVSPLTSTTLSIGYGQDDIEDPDSYDTLSWSGSFGVARRLDAWWPLTTGRFFLSQRQTDYTNSRTWFVPDVFNIGTRQINRDQDLTSESTSATIGIEKTWTEQIQIAVQGGVNYSSTTEAFTLAERNSIFSALDRPPSTITSSDNEWQWVGSATVTATLSPYLSATFSLSHDVVAASGTKGDTNRTGANLGLNHRITDRLSAALTTGLTLNRSIADTPGRNSTDEQTFRIQPRISYRWQQDWNIDAGYTYTINHDSAASSNVQRNSLYVSVHWQHDILQ